MNSKKIVEIKKISSPKPRTQIAKRRINDLPLNDDCG